MLRIEVSDDKQGDLPVVDVLPVVDLAEPIVVIGGLVTSTALTLVLLPILFRRFGVHTASPKERVHG